MCGKQIEEEIHKRIAHHDYHAVFSWGACFHFALKLHELFQHRLAYCPSLYENSHIGHVWARKDNNKAIDINGILDEELLIRINNGGCKNIAIEISPDEVRSHLKNRDYTDTLNARLFELAECIIKTHERFTSAAPTSNMLAKLFTN